MLLGNTLRWDVDYLARQLPVLPAANGFPRKVKPLVRLTERETAAWCIVRGIDYQVEECPMAAGNRHLGYKESLNGLEARSPGTKASFYLGFLERMAPILAGRSRRRRRRPRPVFALRLARPRVTCARSAGSSRRRRRTSRCRSRWWRERRVVAGERPAAAGRAGAPPRRQAPALPRRADRGRRVPQPRRLRAARRRSSTSPRAPSCSRPAAPSTRWCARRSRTSWSRCHAARRSSIPRTSPRSACSPTSVPACGCSSPASDPARCR